MACVHQARATQLTTLKLMEHELLTSPDLQEALAAADPTAGQRSDSDEEWHTANLKLMRREVALAGCSPASLVSAISEATSACHTAWLTAKPDNDFAAVVEPLKRVLSLTRETATLKAAALTELQASNGPVDPAVSPDAGPYSAYDALVDEFDPGARASSVDTVFGDLADFLPGLVSDMAGGAKEEKASHAQDLIKKWAPFVSCVFVCCGWQTCDLLRRPAHTHRYDPKDQQALVEQLMAAVGFDFGAGRLDTSAHPFCGGTSDDVRLCTMYLPHDFTMALMATMHETGHAMYVQSRGCWGRSWRK